MGRAAWAYAVGDMAWFPPAACYRCCKSSVTPTPRPGAVPRRAPQVAMSGNHVGKTMPPDQANITVYATVGGMTAARLLTPA